VFRVRCSIPQVPNKTHVQEDLDDLRSRWRIIPAPAAPSPLKKAAPPPTE